jgi:precorrin-4/cobalt-precorrin-4 C11-methyltransferase
MPRVYFIGAGPGDPELITVKGARLIGQADLVLYAGSLVPEAVVAGAKPGAKVVDSAPLTLEQTHALMMETVRAGGTVARVHTGDPSLYGAVAEQAALLDRDGIDSAIVPGVTAAFAAAAAARASFTVPEATQSLIITRMAGRTPVPEAERLRTLAAHGCSLAVYLSAGDPEGLQEELLAADLPPDTPVVAARAVGWPNEELARTTVEGLAACARERGFTRQTVYLVLPGEGKEAARSKLYDPEFQHGYRKE